MSFGALKWLIDDAPIPSSAAFAVLTVYASYANEHGRAYPAASTVAAKTRQNIKTVRAAIDALELVGALIDTGRRVGETGNVRVFALGMEGIPDVGRLKGERLPHAPAADQEPLQGASEEALPETGTLADEPSLPVSGPKPTRKRVGEPVRNHKPLEEAEASSAPKGEKPTTASGSKGSKAGRSEGWSAPAIADLPPEIRAIAEQWGQAAYDAEAAGHAAWMASQRRIRNATASWHARIVDLGAKPLRAAKAGLRYAAATSPASVAVSNTPTAAAVARCGTAGEGALAEQLRQELVSAMGGPSYGKWIEPCRFDIDDDQLTIVAPSAFYRSYVEQTYAQQLAAIVARIAGGPMHLGWKVEQPA